MSTSFRVSDSPTLVAEGSRIQGNLSFQSQAQVYGIIDGGITQESMETLVIGPSAWISGPIESVGPVVVEGRVDGHITSQTTVRLLPTAQVNGTIQARNLEVRAGAMVDASLKIAA